MTSLVRSRRNTIWSTVFVVAVVLVVAVHVTVTISSLFNRFWEDEAVNLTVPLNLVRGLGYTSDGTLSGSVFVRFDARISTGWPVLLPVAGLLALGVEPVVAARTIPVLFYAVLLAGLWVLGRSVAGRWGALAAITTPLVFDSMSTVSPIQGPADLLGEVPAAAFLVWGLVLLRRRLWLAGLLLGLAIATKLVTALAAVAFVIGGVVLLLGRPARRWLTGLGGAFVAMCLPTLCFEAAAVLTVGRREGADRLEYMEWFITTNGGDPQRYARSDKLQALLGTWFVPGWLTVLILILLVGTVAACLLQRRRIAGSWRGVVETPADSARRYRLALVLGAAAGLVVFLGWWVQSAGTPVWVRHAAPAVYAFVPVLSASLVVCLRDLLARGTEQASAAVPRTGLAQRALAWTTLALMTLVAAWGLSAQTIRALTPDHETLLEQIDEARSFSGLGYDWVAAQWGPPVSIAVLAGFHVGHWDARDAVADYPRLVLASQADRCEDVILQTRRYLVCADPLEP